MEITPLNDHPSGIAADCAGGHRGGHTPAQGQRWEPLLIGMRA
jgi:hypothetical protein